MIDQTLVLAGQRAWRWVSTRVVRADCDRHSGFPATGKDGPQFANILERTGLPVAGRANLECDLLFRQLLQHVGSSQRYVDTVPDAVKHSEVLGMNVING